MAISKRVYSFTGLSDPPQMLMNLSNTFQAGTGSGSLLGSLSPPEGNTSDAYTDVRCSYTPLQRARRLWKPVLPAALRGKNYSASVDESSELPDIPDAKILSELFPSTWGQKFLKFVPNQTGADVAAPPMRVGVVLSGGQAAGGHNVIAGIYDSVKAVNSQSQLIGFLSGPAGVFKHKYKEITEELMAQYRNMGGFDMICSGRDKIETEEQKRASMEVCQKLDLHGLVIIGGDDSNTNGAILAEYFKSNNCSTRVIGVPKTIDGDLKNDYIETSFGFDTAVKTYSELIGNLCADAATSQDRYHFVRLMGRSASNITLECALQTRANLTFIGEEVEAENRSLASICEEICEMIINRAKMGKEFGVILLPEGLIEFIPEIGQLIRELNDLLGHQTDATASPDKVIAGLTPTSRAVLESLPESIRAELMLERDSHGNVQVSRIATEKLIILMVTEELKRRAENVCCAQPLGGADKTVASGHNCGSGKEKFTFIPTGHFFGYEGRCPMPSNFDANYCYALGHTAGALIRSGATGYMAVVRNLKKPADQWIPAGCPITLMMNIERRKGRDVPVIKKYLVELNKPMFQNFKKVREEWKYKDLYRNCGPIQFEGPSADITNFSIDPPTANYLLPQEKQNQSKCWISKSLNCLSPLQVERLHFRPVMNAVLLNPKTRALVAKKWEAGDNAQVDRFIRRTFPLQCEQHGMRGYAVQPVDDLSGYSGDDIQQRIGVVLTGQPVPGATNVILGLFERLTVIGGKLIGFKGVSGLLNGSHIIVEKSDLSLYVNQGGFEMLGRTAKTKHRLRTDEGVAAVAKVCTDLELTGLVIIGGQTSLTDATVLTEHFLAQNIPTRVIGVPANQENNVQHPLLETAIGFDTTARTYASLIGNLLTDAASATKYWYFVRLMGNVPSHITLEVALETHSNFTIVSEKYVAENMSLRDVVRDIADVVVNRASMGKNFGSVLVPEGVVSSLPQMKALLTEIDKLLGQSIDNPAKLAEIRQTIVDLKTNTNMYKQLTPWSAALLSTLPLFFREQLVIQTPSGRLELSEIAAEQLIAEWVGHELEERRVLGLYNGNFNPICHYFGFQGRSAMPTNFDCALATAHGYLASILVESNLTGFVTSVRGLCSHSSEWRFSAVPLAILLRLLPESETSAYGRRIPMVPCADVNMKGAAYKAYVAAAELWETNDLYCNPGPIQFAGISASSFNRTLYEDQQEYMVMLEQLEQLLGLVGGVCSFGVNKSTLKTAVTSLGALAAILADKTSN